MAEYTEDGSKSDSGAEDDQGSCVVAGLVAAAIEHHTIEFYLTPDRTPREAAEAKSFVDSWIWAELNRGGSSSVAQLGHVSVASRGGNNVVLRCSEKCQGLGITPGLSRIVAVNGVPTPSAAAVREQLRRAKGTSVVVFTRGMAARKLWSIP